MPERVSTSDMALGPVPGGLAAGTVDAAPCGIADQLLGHVIVGHHLEGLFAERQDDGSSSCRSRRHEGQWRHADGNAQHEAGEAATEYRPGAQAVESTLLCIFGNLIRCLWTVTLAA